VCGAMDEVNISYKMKQSIGDVLSMGLARVPFTVFEYAADEVLRLLYQNTFKKYLSFVEKKPVVVRDKKNRMSFFQSG